MKVRTTTLLVAMLWMAAVALPAAQAPVTKSNMIKVSATIQAIDSTTRTLTLRDDKGNEDTFSVGDGVQRARDQFRCAAVTTHHIDGDGCHGSVAVSGPKARPLPEDLLFGLDFGGLLDDSLAAIEAVRRDAVTQVRLTRLRVDGQRGLRECVVRTMHAALGRRFATFLNGHGSIL